MPELPEVETIRLGLENNILDKKINSVDIVKPRLIKSPLKEFQGILDKNKFIAIDRIGKLLIFNLADHNFLLIHLKMTGQLIYVKNDELIAGGHNLPKVEKLPNKYSYIIFNFVDNSKLFFNDMRLFGYLKIVDQSGRDKVLKRYGIEPLQSDFTFARFRDIFKNRKGTLKPLLLNQEIIAGIGNIYADEICFRAKILPQRKVNTLSEKEIKNLYNACEYIIKKAIEKKGTTFRDYRDANNRKGNFVDFLKVYGRAKQKCLRCKKANIKKINLGGRGTHYCPNCQK